MYFDSHVHFDVRDGQQGIVETIERAVAAGVTRMIAVGGSDALNALAMEAAAAYPANVRAAVGFDRDCATSEDGELKRMADALRELAARHPTRIAALGETGLDYHYTPETADAQRALFGMHLRLAGELDLPVVIHSREADDDTIAGIRNAGSPRAVLHCFTGTDAFARRLVALGMFVSFSGIVTFRNASALRAVARELPADRLLIETDAPYLAPVPLRGRRNEPAYVREVAACVAAERGMEPEALATLTAGNAERLFGMQAE